MKKLIEAATALAKAPQPRSQSVTLVDHSRKVAWLVKS